MDHQQQRMFATFSLWVITVSTGREIMQLPKKFPNQDKEKKNTRVSGPHKRRVANRKIYSCKT